MIPNRKPILAEPDLRYWRRRANFRVRKARWTRSLLRAAMGQRRVSAEHYLGPWLDIGTPQRLAELERRLAAPMPS